MDCVQRDSTTPHRHACRFLKVASTNNNTAAAAAAAATTTTTTAATSYSFVLFLLLSSTFPLMVLAAFAPFIFTFSSNIKRVMNIFRFSLIARFLQPYRGVRSVLRLPVRPLLELNWGQCMCG